MFDTKKKRLPYLSEYIASCTAQSPYARRDAIAASGCITVPLAIVGSVSLLGNLMSWPLAVGVGLLVGGPMAGWMMSALAKKFGKARTPEEARRFEVFEAASKYNQSIQRKKLHQELDPVAAQLLESCAYYYKQTMSLVNGPIWDEAANNGQYVALREQCAKAANESMQEAIMLCQHCLGKPERNRSDDLGSVIQDFVSLEIEDAIGGLREVVKADSAKYAYRSPHVNSIFEPVRDIAEKLKQLSIEVEKIQTDIVKNASTLKQVESASSLDLVLRELQMVRQAEDELDDEQHLRH